MEEMLVAAPLGARRPLTARMAGWGSAMLVVVGFWWLATGVLVAAQRDATTRTLAAAAATLLAAAGLALVIRTRDQRSPGAARLAFVGGALLWLWSMAGFYGGWLVGPPPAAEVPPRTLPLALDAIRATAYAQLGGLAAIAAAWVVTRGRANRAALAALLTFWAAHETARLNVFVGVPNPATDWLPPHLEFLTRYFGPPVVSLTLVLTVVVWAAVTAWLVQRARQAPDAHARHLAALLAILALLATVEHVVLAIPAGLPLWDGFMQVRGY